MALIPRLLLGNYGDGTIGLKTSVVGYDVTVRADDDDTEKRTFNSRWAELLPIHLIGKISVSSSAFVYVSSGLSYLPFFEARQYVPSTHTFYDDHNVNYAAGSSTVYQTFLNVAYELSTNRLRVMCATGSGDAVYCIYRKQAN